MADKKHNTDNKKRYYLKRDKTKIDSIFRLTSPLKRDIDRYTGQMAYTDHQTQKIEQHVKLDVIANTLLEIRDKLEKILTAHHNVPYNYVNQTPINPNFNYNPNYNVANPRIGFY